MLALVFPDFFNTSFSGRYCRPHCSFRRQQHWQSELEIPRGVHFSFRLYFGRAFDEGIGEFILCFILVCSRLLRSFSQQAQVINQAMPTLLNHMSDKEQIVRDTTAWTLGAVCELHPQVARDHLQLLMPCLAEHLTEKPAVASQVRMNLVLTMHLNCVTFYAPPRPSFPGLLRHSLSR